MSLALLLIGRERESEASGDGSGRSTLGQQSPSSVSEGDPRVTAAVQQKDQRRGDSAVVEGGQWPGTRVQCAVQHGEGCVIGGAAAGEPAPQGQGVPDQAQVPAPSTALLFSFLCFLPAAAPPLSNT